MEHDARKMTALVLLLLLLGAGVVGVGYAAFSGQASTYNEDNSATAGYIYLDNANWNAVSADTNVLPISTYTWNTGSASNYAYYLGTGADATQAVYGVGSTANYQVAEISGATKDYTLTNKTNAAISQVKFSVTAPLINATSYDTSEFEYILKVTNGSNSIYILADDATQYGILTLTSFDKDASITLTVQLCVGYLDTGAVYIPTSKIGIVKETSDETHTIKAHNVDAITKGPVNLDEVDFAFTVQEYTA